MTCDERRARRNASALLRAALIAAAVASAAAACAGAGSDPAPPAGQDCAVIAVSDNGWHAGLYMPADAFAADSPVRAAHPEARWFAIGWGDARAYPGPLGPLNGAAAIFWPTPSVLHLAALDRDPRRAYRQDHVDLALSARQRARLAGVIEAELALGPDGNPERLADGLDPRGSAFYAARSSYHLFNTCNVWLARRLEEAGLEAGWAPVRLDPGSLLRALKRTTPQSCP